MPCSPAARCGVTPRPGSGPSPRARRRPTQSAGRMRRRTRWRPKEEPRAAIAPETTEAAASRWLGSFLETWEPGTGAPIENREPATGRHLATITGSTPDDVARAAEAAKAAQPAWAATSYQERARVLRRAAEIYDANRGEFGTWTQRETGASHSKMHHESNFAYHEILNAATLPSQAYGSLMPSAVKGRLSMVRRVPAGVIGAIT